MALNALNWFEIPVSDMARAKKFYGHIYNTEMPDMDMPDMKMAAFPSDQWSEGNPGGVGGVLAESEWHKPSNEGSVIYLNANPSIDEHIRRAEEAGANIVVPKTEIGNNMGFFAMFIDSEGNKVGFHANS